MDLDIEKAGNYIICFNTSDIIRMVLYNFNEDETMLYSKG